jgi:hypothetical protein
MNSSLNEAVNISQHSITSIIILSECIPIKKRELLKYMLNAISGHVAYTEEMKKCIQKLVKH